MENPFIECNIDANLAWTKDEAEQERMREAVTAETGMHPSATKYAYRNTMWCCVLPDLGLTPEAFRAEAIRRVVAEAHRMDAEYKAKEKVYQAKRREELKAKRANPTPATRSQPSRGIKKRG